MGDYSFQNCIGLKDIKFLSSTWLRGYKKPERIFDGCDMPKVCIYGYRCEDGSDSIFKDVAEEFGAQFKELVILGDADRNGSIGVNDAALTLKYVLDNSTSSDMSDTEYQLTAADVDGDGVITAKDASCIFSKALNKNFKFSYELEI